VLVFFNDFHDLKSKNLKTKNPMQQKRKPQKQILILKYFVFCTPGYYRGPTDRKHGHKKIRGFRDMAGYGTENAESQLDGVQDK